MTARAVPAVRIDYPKHWFMVGSAMLVFVIAYATYSYTVALEDFARYFWLGAGAAAGAVLLLFFGPPLFTHHLLGEKGMRVRMGLLINATVPYESVTEVRETSVKRASLSVGLGVKYSSILATVFVVSSFGDFVSVKLDKPRRLGGLLGPEVSQIVLSVSDKALLMATLEERLLGKKEE